MALELLMRFVDGLRSLSSLPTVFLKCCPRTGHHILPEVSLLLVRVQYIFFTYTFQNNGYFLYYDIIFFFFFFWTLFGIIISHDFAVIIVLFDCFLCGQVFLISTCALVIFEYLELVLFFVCFLNCTKFKLISQDNFEFEFYPFRGWELLTACHSPSCSYAPCPFCYAIYKSGIYPLNSQVVSLPSLAVIQF